MERSIRDGVTSPIMVYKVTSPSNFFTLFTSSGAPGAGYLSFEKISELFLEQR
ncbi:hypothetical protein ACJIZ3_002371 [Penstemon smallii]|uniref:Uncharacterized protein n=1 Tax=Penstemon smallii TaxID=265156 RepID=A0ABD3U9Z7_9LAMI